MKALFLKNGRELDHPIHNILMTNFPHLEIISTDLVKNDLLDVINELGQISLLIINVNHQPIKLVEQLDTIGDFLGVLPMVFICNSQSIKTHLNEKILDNQKTNFLVQLPLNSVELQAAVQSALNWIKETEFEQSVGEFTFEDLQPMRIKNFFIFNQVPYDVYMQLTATKFGKIIQGHHPYSHQQIQSYSQKGIKYLYLKKDEGLKFLTSSIKNITKFYAAKKLENKRIILLHQQSIFFIREFIQLLNVTDDIIHLTQLFVDSCSKFIKIESSMDEIMSMVIKNRSITFAQQTLLTIYLSRAILLRMRWNSDLALSKIALAAILQDIYLTNDEMIKIRSINDPYLKTFTEDEQQEFFDHPEKAAVIARLFNGFTDVDFILLEHHERPSGDGFPKGVNSSSLTTISCIFILVTNVVAKIAQRDQYSSVILSEVIKELKTTFSSGNFKEPYKLLEKMAKEMQS